MFTVCPKCALTLVVTAADLRVAQGYVRCGRCSNVFNALARLSEDRPPATAAPSPDPMSKKSPAATFAEPATQKPDVQSLETVRNPSPAGSPSPASSSPGDGRGKASDEAISEDALEFNPAAADVTKVFVEQTPPPEWTAATGTFQAIRLEAEESARAQQRELAGQTDARPDTSTDIEIDSELISTMAELGDPEQRAEPETGAGPDPKPSAATKPAATRDSSVSAKLTTPEPAVSGKSTAPAREPAVSKKSAPPTYDPPISTKPGSSAEEPFVAASMSAADYPPTSPLVALWAAGSVLMALLLGVQILHHYRNDLATNARLNGPLTSLYASLGMPLVPRWNLRAYEVRQLGASTETDSPGQITVRASVKNGAPQAQPLPLLRVTLQDRFGNHIAARDVPPRSYLPHTASGSPFLSAGQRIDAEMAFVDPGSNAVGFEIDACLPMPGGTIACANDSAGR